MIEIKDLDHFIKLLQEHDLDLSAGKMDDYEDYIIVHFDLPFTKSTLLKEANGLTFSKHTGRLMARPNHYIQDLSATFYVDWGQPHCYIRDLGRTIFAPYFVRWKSSRFCTVNGADFEVENYVSDHPKYFKICKELYERRLSPTFQWDGANLWLFVIRELISGNMLSYNETIECGDRYDINTNIRYESKDFFDKPTLMIFDSGRLIRGEAPVINIKSRI